MVIIYIFWFAVNAPSLRTLWNRNMIRTQFHALYSTHRALERAQSVPSPCFQVVYLFYPWCPIGAQPYKNTPCGDMTQYSLCLRNALFSRVCGLSLCRLMTPYDGFFRLEAIKKTVVWRQTFHAPNKIQKALRRFWNKDQSRRFPFSKMDLQGVY